MNAVTITITLEVDTPEADLDQWLPLALDNLAAVMVVQAEDGVYLSGNPDDGDDAILPDGTTAENALVAHCTVRSVVVQ